MIGLPCQNSIFPMKQCEKLNEQIILNLNSCLLFLFTKHRRLVHTFTECTGRKSEGISPTLASMWSPGHPQGLPCGETGYVMKLSIPMTKQQGQLVKVAWEQEYSGRGRSAELLNVSFLHKTSFTTILAYPGKKGQQFWGNARMYMSKLISLRTNPHLCHEWHKISQQWRIQGDTWQQ